LRTAQGAHNRTIERDMADVNVLIAFYSRTGVTEALAKAIAEGAEWRGAEVRLSRARGNSLVPR
jgi:multimeric flavodoxin WrbA